MEIETISTKTLIRKSTVRCRCDFCRQTKQHQPLGGGCRYLFVHSAHNPITMNRTLADRAAYALSGCNLCEDTHILIDPQMLAECERAGLFVRKGHVPKRNKNKHGFSHWIYLQMAQRLQELEKELM